MTAASASPAPSAQPATAPTDAAHADQVLYEVEHHLAENSIFCIQQSLKP